VLLFLQKNLKIKKVINWIEKRILKLQPNPSKCFCLPSQKKEKLIPQNLHIPHVTPHTYHSFVFSLPLHLNGSHSSSTPNIFIISLFSAWTQEHPNDPINSPWFSPTAPFWWDRVLQQLKQPLERGAKNQMGPDFVEMKSS